jgi:hypothetical protein
MIRVKQQNKIIITLFLVLSVITALVFAGIESPEAAIRRKMEGLWNMEFENSYMVESDSTYEFMSVLLLVENDSTIELPCVYEPCDIDFGGKTLLDDDIFDDKETLIKYRKHNEEVAQKAKGVWKVTSTNPDSVFFNVPANPFHGKYAVRFFIDNNGWVNMTMNINMSRNIYKMELKNDSTLLICNKSGNVLGPGFRNWEK